MDRAATGKWLFLVVLGALIAFVVWKWPAWRAQGEAGAAYAARITCSCRYIEERTAESCARDIQEDAGIVLISEEPEAKIITGSVPLLGLASARFRPGYGCLIDPKPAPR